MARKQIEPVIEPAETELRVVGVHRSFVMISGPINQDEPQTTPCVLYRLATKSFSHVAPISEFSRFITFREPGDREFTTLPKIPAEIAEKLRQ